MSQLTVLKKMKISEMPVLQNMKKKNNSLFCKIEIYQSITASCPEKINKSQLTVLQIIKTSEYTVHCFAKYQTSKLPNFKI